MKRRTVQLKRNRRIRASHGFTLIELMIVITIIAILAEILFAVFSRAREAGRRVACVSNMRQLGAAFRMYAQDYDDRLPNHSPPASAYFGHWVPSQMIRYDEPSRVQDGAIFPYVRNAAVYICPSHAYGDRLRLSYGMNYNLGELPDSRVRDSAATILLIEHPFDQIFYSGAFVAPLFDGIPRTAAMPCMGERVCGGPWGGCLGTLACRHNLLTNALFVDGHVKGFPRGRIVLGMFAP